VLYSCRSCRPVCLGGERGFAPFWTAVLVFPVVLAVLQLFNFVKWFMRVLEIVFRGVYYAYDYSVTT
jgi:hypothetical protein